LIEMIKRYAEDPQSQEKLLLQMQHLGMNDTRFRFRFSTTAPAPNHPRLLCFNGEYAVRYALRLGTSVLSQRQNFFRNSSATCVATLAGHKSGVTSVAFHPTAPLLVTCSKDNTVKMWRLCTLRCRRAFAAGFVVALVAAVVAAAAATAVVVAVVVGHML
jgi:hypothetical protein